jgi:WD40 repeat protein
MSASELQRGSPYQGLIPYDEADAPFFFGREKEARLIIANLFASPLTLLYGASGVGKSSVLRAGVAHQLRAREDLLVVVFNAWQSKPLVDLQNKIAGAADRLNVRLEVPSESTHLSDYLAHCAARLDRRLMIILDQFEEYFLYHPQEDEFAPEFARAVTQSRAPVSFLISIREDFYAKLDRFEGRIPALYDNYLRIEHLDRRAARVAIEKPIDQYNRQYVTNGQFAIEPQLVDAVLRQVETGRVIIGEAGRGVVEAADSEKGAARIETPFLQLVMTRLWEKESGEGSHKLRLQTLKDLGGAENIVRTHLDAVITRLSVRDQEIAASMFHYLVTPSGTKIAYTASDLAGSAELKEGEVVRVLDNLAHGDVRILRTVEPSPDRPTAPRYEIFHDVLAPAILSWRTAYVQAQERADAERRAEEERKRADEQALVASRFRRLSVALAVVILLALGAVVLAVAQTVRAKQNAVKAENYARESNQLREEGKRLVALAQSERESAEAARTEANLAQQEAEEERSKTAEQIEIAEQRKAEAEEAQDVARVKTLAAATANAAANQATITAAEQARGTRVAFANLLSVQSKTILDEHPQLGTLLAVEAMRATRAEDPPVPAAEETLRQTLAYTGGRIFSSQDWDKDEQDLKDVALSPDGRWLASASASKVRLFDVAATNSNEPARIFEGARSPMAFSPDGRWLITSGKQLSSNNSSDNKKHSTILLWDLKNVASNSQPITLESRQPQFDVIRVSPDSRWLVAGSDADSTLTLWDLKSSALTPKSLIAAEPPSAGKPRDSLITLAISPDSRWLLTSSGVAQGGIYIQGPGTVRLWDLTALDRGAQPLQLIGHKYSVTETAFSTDGRWLATGTVDCDDGVRLWDLKSANPSNKPILLDHKGSIGAIAFSPSSHVLVTGSGSSERCPSDLRARIWDMETIASAAKPYLLPASEGPVFTIAFSPDETLLITVVGRGYSTLNSPFQDSLARIKNARTLGNLGLQGGATVHGWAWQQVLEDQSARVPDVTLNLPRTANMISVSSDSHWLMAQDNNKALVLDLTAGSGYGWPMLTMRGHDSSLVAMNFSPDNRWVVTGGVDKTARLWNLSSNGVASPLTLTANTPSTTNRRETVVVQSSDRRLLVATANEPSPPGETESSADSYARFGSIALVSDLRSDDPSKPLVLRGHKGKIKSATFSSDNRWLVTGSNDQTARLWDLSAADPAAHALVFGGHQGAVDDVAISADKHWLATASHDGGARLWDLTAADPAARPVVLNTFKNPEAATYTWTNRVYMSPDSRWLVTGASYRWASARLWDLKASDPSASFTELGKIDTEFNFGCAFSPDGRWLIVSRDLGAKEPALKNDVHLWDLTHKPLGAPFILRGGPDKFVSKVEFSSDSRWLFTSGYEKMIRRWNLTAPDPTAAPLLLNSPVSVTDESLGEIALSPDNRWLVADSKAPATHVLWDLNATDPNSSARVLKNPSGYGISEVAFDPESRWLVTSADGSSSDFEGFLSKSESVLEGHNIRWDLTAPDPSVAPVRLPGGRVVGGAAVSADGRWLITVGGPGLQFWNMRRNDLIDLACRTAGRNLSEEEWKTYFPGQSYRKTCGDLPARQ